MVKYHKVIMNCNEWTEDGPEKSFDMIQEKQKKSESNTVAMIMGIGLTGILLVLFLYGVARQRAKSNKV